MADLYNLDLDVGEDSSPEEEPQQTSFQENEDWDEAGDREEVDLAPVLQQKLAPPTTTTDKDLHADGGLDLGDLLTGNNASASSAATKEQLASLPYTRLYTAWLQESKSPELLPLDVATVEAMRQAIAANEDIEVETGNMNMDSLFESLLRIDAERVKFLLADLLKRRLQKIQAYPLHMRTLTDRMSKHEVEFLKEYGSAIERHFKTTVTDHFPQDVWKQLDAEDMIDEPDFDEFVFLKCLEDITIGDIEPVRHYAEGDYLILRYQRIRNLFLEGKVELM